MPKSEQFGIVIPTRNAPSELCAGIADRLSKNAADAAFDYGLKIIFLVNDSKPGFSADLGDILAKRSWLNLSVQVMHSPHDEPTVEDNLKNNLGRHLDLLPERFIAIGNSDHIRFKALQSALDFMIEANAELMLVAMYTSEAWQNKIIRRMSPTPDLSIFGFENALPRKNCVGTDIFARAFHDYGPFDYLAYIGCQIYSRRFFKTLCSVHLREPLYSLPLATLEVEARGGFLTGYFHTEVVERIEALSSGAYDPKGPDNWWVTGHRTSRGLSAEIATSVISSSLDLGDAAFSTLIHSRIVAIPRANRSYGFGHYLPTAIRRLFTGFVGSLQHKAYRFAHHEFLEIADFGKRLQKVDLHIDESAKAKICDWVQRFPLGEGLSGREPLQAWADEQPGIFALLETYMLPDYELTN